MNFNLSGHYTRGRGYYEQFRESDDLSDYGIDPLQFIGANDTIEVTSSDIIRRRWLDNHFYGGVFSLKYFNKGLNLSIGGGANNYLGGHYGEIIWAEFASNVFFGFFYREERLSPKDDLKGQHFFFLTNPPFSVKAENKSNYSKAAG